MTGDERRKDRDPGLVVKLQARLAHIKVAIAAKRTRELADDWSRANVIEGVILRHRIEREANGHHPHGN